MHVSPNFRTKAEFESAVATGKVVTTFRPGPVGSLFRGGPFSYGDNEGVITVTGPWTPDFIAWQAKVAIKNGRVTEILSCSEVDRPSNIISPL